MMTKMETLLRADLGEFNALTLITGHEGVFLERGHMYWAWSRLKISTWG